MRARLQDRPVGTHDRHRAEGAVVRRDRRVGDRPDEVGDAREGAGPGHVDAPGHLGRGTGQVDREPMRARDDGIVLPDTALGRGQDLKKLSSILGADPFLKEQACAILINMAEMNLLSGEIEGSAMEWYCE